VPIPFLCSSNHGLTQVLAIALLLGTPAGRALGQASLRQAHPSKAQSSATAEPADLSALIPEDAQISLAAGTLEVVAKNSALVPILESVARMTGIEILNLPEESPRVSGTYGPGPVKKVLADLMGASGFNFIMAGGKADTAPSKLLLERPGREAALTASTPPSHSPAQGEPLPEDGRIGPQEPLGPGALRPTPADAPIDENERIQRNLQRLQHIQEQQEQNAPQ
jgi:hypothetical protein